MKLVTTKFTQLYAREKLMSRFESPGYSETFNIIAAIRDKASTLVSATNRNRWSK